MKSKVQKVGIPAVILFFLILTSCGYGFFNLDKECGIIEIEFEITGASFGGIDSIKYELTPPKGMSTSVRIKLEGESAWENFSNADIGTWNIKATLYSGNEEVQTFERNIEVLTDMKTKLRIEADWVSIEYIILFETWQYAINDNTSVDNTVKPAFTFKEMRTKPGIVEDYHSGERLNSVYTSIIGTDIANNLCLLKLIYPNGSIYEFGSDNYSRSISMSHFIEVDGAHIKDDRVEIQWVVGYGENVLNGAYNLRMADFNGKSFSTNADLDLDYDTLMPEITPPLVYNSSAGFTFIYDFGALATTGTKFHYLIDTSNDSIVYGNDNIFPPDDASLVGTDVGNFIIAPGQLTAGNTYQFVCAAIQHYTITPILDATTAGVIPDLRPYSLVDSINNIYGENAGYVIAKVVEFTAE